MCYHAKQEVIALTKRVVCIVALLLFSAQAMDAQGLWSRLDDAPVGGARAAAVVGTGEALYLIWNESNDRAPQFWRYGVADGRWSALNTQGLPRGAFGPGASLVWDEQHTLYALGGGQTNDSARTTFYRYDLETNLWTRLGDTPHPQGTGNALVWDPASKRIHAMLGSTELGSAFARYDPRFDRWSALPFPDFWGCTDAGASLTSLGRFGLFAFKGRCEGKANGDFALFNPFKLQWQALPALPLELGVDAGASLLWLGGFDSRQATFVYALGGGDAFYRFRLDDNRWERLSDLPCPVGTHPGNRLAYLGGTLSVWQGAPASSRCGGRALLRLSHL